MHVHRIRQREIVWKRHFHRNNLSWKQSALTASCKQQYRPYLNCSTLIFLAFFSLEHFFYYYFIISFTISKELSLVHTIGNKAYQIKSQMYYHTGEIGICMQYISISTRKGKVSFPCAYSYGKVISSCEPGFSRVLKSAHDTSHTMFCLWIITASSR